jgi:hypothetical protein
MEYAHRELATLSQGASDDSQWTKITKYQRFYVNRWQPMNTERSEQEIRFYVIITRNYEGSWWQPGCRQYIIMTECIIWNIAYHDERVETQCVRRSMDWVVWIESCRAVGHWCRSSWSASVFESNSSAMSSDCSAVLHRSVFRSLLVSPVWTCYGFM